MNAREYSTDWSEVLSCREFWIRYFGLSDERVFKSTDKFLRQHQHRLYWALGELLQGRAIRIPVVNDFNLVIEFGSRRESLYLVVNGKRKRSLLGWVDPHAYNKLFRLDEIVAIADLAESDELTVQDVFLLLLGYWGISEQDKPNIKSIRQELTRQLRATKLFSRDEIGFVVARFLKNLDRETECEWIEHPKWGWVTNSPMSLRTPDDADIPDGVSFDFRLFKRFTDSLEC